MKTFPHYLQLDAMDCGPTCLSMIAKYYGKNYSLQTLRSRSFLTREGVSMLGISDASESIGFHTSGVRIHRRKGGVHLPRARRTGKVRIGNSTAARTDHPLWQRTAFNKDHDGNGIHRHEGKKPAQQVTEFKIRVYA